MLRPASHPALGLVLAAFVLSACGADFSPRCPGAGNIRDSSGQCTGNPGAANNDADFAGADD